MSQLRNITGYLLFIVFLVSQSAVADDKFLEAARGGDITRLQSLLDKGINVNSARADGLTALSEAVLYNHEQTVNFLLRAGADANMSDDYGVNILHLACINQNVAMLKKLTAAGANPNAAKLNGETPLMTCANFGVVNGVQELLARGADVNASENRQDQTALMWAAAEGHSEIVRLLVGTKGIDIEARSRLIPEPEPHILEMSPDLSIWASNYPSTIRWPQVSGGFTALYFAAQRGHVDIANILINAGAQLNDAHPEYGSPLIIAIASGHEEMALLFLQKGSDPNVKDGWGVTPLHYALHEGLLNLNGVDPIDHNSADWARSDMSPALIQTLLDMDADPNARIEYEFPYLVNPFLARNDTVPAQISVVGATPLMLAAASGNLQAMNLLEEVSDISAKTIGGATLFMLAAGAGAESGIRSEDEALAAAKYVMEELGDTDVDAHLTDIAVGGPGRGTVDGRTALHFAVYYRWPKMVEFLIENGADVNAEDRYGTTPLMYALGDPEGRLAQNVGDFNQDHRFQRPGGGRQSAGSGDETLADMLLKYGATPCECKPMDLTGR